MNPEAAEYAIAFADVEGSTRLYETVGDEAAKALIIDLESEIASVITRAGGFVQEVVGDEVLSRFRDVDTAICCAAGMHEATGAFSKERGTPMSVRIGLHYGRTLVDGGRIFGDTVNTAARIAAIAQGGQIIASEDVVSRLSAPLRAIAQRFDRVKVKGKRAPIVVYNVQWQPSLFTEVQPSAIAPEAAVGTLRLRYKARRCRLQPDQGEFYIGRAADNDLVVMARSASRRHATVDFRRNRFVLCDRSTNGTYVETQDGAIVFLRREALPLWGCGRIALGAPVDEANEHLIEFECE